MENKTREEIQQEVAKIVLQFCSNNWREFELSTEGSLTDSYKYLSKDNVAKVLQMCFNETYNRLIK